MIELLILPSFFHLPFKGKSSIVASEKHALALRNGQNCPETAFWRELHIGRTPPHLLSHVVILKKMQHIVC